MQQCNRKVCLQIIMQENMQWQSIKETAVQEDMGEQSLGEGKNGTKMVLRWSKIWLLWKLFL